jgi:predicted methyltransferase
VIPKTEAKTTMKSISGRVNFVAIFPIALFATVAFLLNACAGMSAISKPSVLSNERIAEIISSPDRSVADRGNDAQRKPDQMLTFIGVRSGMVALDLSAGGGYTTELLSRAVGPTGRVYGQSAPRGPSSPSRLTSPQALAERAKNPLVANIIPVVRQFEDPVPQEVAAGGLDLVTLIFNYHDLGHMGVDRNRMNRAVFAALKSGGLYVIADHSGRLGTGISEAATLHRIEEDFLRKEVEDAGFKLVGQGNFWRNPSDLRDKNTPEKSQPKDGFVLKFVKP